MGEGQLDVLAKQVGMWLRKGRVQKHSGKARKVRVRQDLGETKLAVDRLLGNRPEARFEFIQENAAFVTDLDI